jgi:hypothetical protein
LGEGHGTGVRHAWLVLLNFGQGRDLKIDIGEPIAIQQGAGIHRLILPVRMLATNQLGSGIPLEVSGCAWLSMTGMDWLGTWRTEHPLATRNFEFDGTLVLPLTDEQLAVIEKKRAGREVRIQFNADAVLYDPATPEGYENNPDRWPVRSFQESVYIYSETWQRMLTQTAVAMSMALVVPVPLDSSPAAKVGTHLREAIRKVNDGEYQDAVMAARRAIDDMATAWATEKSVVSTVREKRTLDQRLSLLRHALFSLASASAHGDPVAGSITWDRENAMAVIAGVAALAACKNM